MEHNTAPPTGVTRSTTCYVQCAIKMGSSAHYFEMWHNRRPPNAILAIWRNEIGPKRVLSPQGQT